MFVDETLQDHLETSSTIRTQSAIIAEWNMNIAGNIRQIGNYRFRPNDSSDARYQTLTASFDANDEVSQLYMGATDSDIIVDGGTTDEGLPTTFLSKKDKEKLLYSLEDCFGKFRPRSGINKLRYFSNKYSHHTNIDMARRPRYYIADRYDPFKYWTSYRTENGIERGIANKTINTQYYIDDAAPYVVYTEPVPANRVVVKMQTNVGDIDLGPFNNTNSPTSFEDPFYGATKQTTPTRWKIQYLQDNNWLDAISFNPNSVRADGTRIIKEDGYVEIAYGLIIPEQYREIFFFEREYASADFLPQDTVSYQPGTAYLVKSSDTDPGVFHMLVSNDPTEYVTFPAVYGWYVSEETTDRLTNYVTDLTSPAQYLSESDNQLKYREFQYIGGIRIVVETMNVFDSTFDLIEMSPRLAVNLSEKTQGFSVTKSASDLGLSGMPVGQLLASTGTLQLFDYDQAFFQQNTDSIISKYTTQNVQIKLYEGIAEVGGFDYYSPIKTMYYVGFPQVTSSDRKVTLNLRDLFFYFETTTAPQVLIQNASVSYAISMLLDYAGFSNYSFKRVDYEDEMVIPYFSIGPDMSIAQVLSDIAISSQSAMFFDEYNNFIVMSKDYIMPTVDQRDTDVTLYGSKDFARSNVLENTYSNDNALLSSGKKKLANIVELASQSNEVFNDGTINYTTRYIQRSVGSIKQASLTSRDQTWIYKPSLLWEVSSPANVRSQNDEMSQQSGYVLGAIPLNTDLSIDVPKVSGHKLVNNIIDLGEAVFWMSRYNGYLYANGEIIRYDAIQYSIPGLSVAESSQDNVEGDNVWITSTQEYQRYFAKVPFNGKIYPTGLVRIYSEPNYETISTTTRLKNGAVAKHGRGQFGTEIVKHNAGLSVEWSSDERVRGVDMDFSYLSDSTKSAQVLTNQSTTTTVGKAGTKTQQSDGSYYESRVRAQSTTRNGIVKNFLTNVYSEESTVNRLFSTQTGTVQSSALVMNGSSFNSTDQTPGFVSYIYKPLEDRFVHFGTRMRIIGKIDNNETRGQSPYGVTTYYTAASGTSDKTLAIGGSSGGLAVLLNPETNNGYYFEILALTESKLTDYADDAGIDNIIFYKVKKDANDTGDTAKAIPIKLWGGVGNILVDNGLLTGQYRMASEENPTVYDLSVEYQKVGSSLRFYLNINNVLVATVDDDQPLEIFNNMALFSRGSSRVMFENVYALTNNYSQNTTFSLDTLTSGAFGDMELNANNSFQKYSISGIIQSTYLSGIGPSEAPKYKIYFEEFGTIMREAAYFNVRYDKAYPALYAKLAPTFNKLKGYTVSGFTAGAYKAEFLVFNATDTSLTLDSQSGNYLRILGITFTQQSQHELSVDEYFSKKSDISNPTFVGVQDVSSPLTVKKEYQDIKFSRMTYGKKQFSITAPYIQTQDDASNLMSWLTSKIMKPRKAVGVNVFALPTVQLGDIVEIDYKNENNVDEVSVEGTRFVVYSINYQKDSSGPTMTLFLSEVQ